MESGLHKIIFIIEHLPEHEMLSRTFLELWMSRYEAERVPMESAARYLRDETVVWEASDGMRDETAESAAGACADAGSGKPQTGILVVTDRPDIGKLCAETSCAVIGYLHEQNADSSFTGVRYLIEDISGLDADFCEMVYRRSHGLPCTILETERCIVREIETGDVDRLYEIYAEPSITAYIESLYADRQEEISYTKDYIANVYGFYGYGMWIVEDRASGNVIGRAGIEPKEDCAELGYVIAKEYQSQGYATEVCRAILAYARDKLGLTEVCARVRKDNAASVRICEKLGFEPAHEGFFPEEQDAAGQKVQTWIKNLQGLPW